MIIGIAKSHETDGDQAETCCFSVQDNKPLAFTSPLLLTRIYS